MTTHHLIVGNDSEDETIAAPERSAKFLATLNKDREVIELLEARLALSHKNADQLREQINLLRENHKAELSQLQPQITKLQSEIRTQAKTNDYLRKENQVLISESHGAVRELRQLCVSRSGSGRQQPQEGPITAIVSNIRQDIGDYVKEIDALKAKTVSLAKSEEDYRRAAADYKVQLEVQETTSVEQGYKLKAALEESTKLRNDIGVMQKTCREGDEQIRQLRSERAEMNKWCKQAVEMQDSLLKQVDRLTKDKSDYKTEVESLISKLRDVQSEREQLKGTEEIVTSNLKQKNATIYELEEENQAHKRLKRKLEGQLASAQNEITEKDRRAAQALEKASQNVQAKEQQLAEVRQYVQAKEQQIVELQGHVQAKEEQIAELLQHVQTKEQQLVEQRKRAQPKEQQLVELRENVQAKEQQIVELREHVDTKEQQLLELQEHAQAKEQQLEDLQDHAQAKDQHLAELREHAQHSEQQLQELTEHAEAKEQQLMELQEQLRYYSGKRLVETRIHEISNDDKYTYQQKSEYKDSDVIAKAEEKTNDTTDEYSEEVDSSVSVHVKDQIIHYSGLQGGEAVITAERIRDLNRIIRNLNDRISEMEDLHESACRYKDAEIHMFRENAAKQVAKQHELETALTEGTQQNEVLKKKFTEIKAELSTHRQRIAFQQELLSDMGVQNYGEGDDVSDFADLLKEWRSRDQAQQRYLQKKPNGINESKPNNGTLLTNVQGVASNIAPGDDKNQQSAVTLEKLHIEKIQEIKTLQAQLSKLTAENKQLYHEKQRDVKRLRLEADAKTAEILGLRRKLEEAQLRYQKKLQRSRSDIAALKTEIELRGQEEDSEDSEDGESTTCRYPEHQAAFTEESSDQDKPTLGHKNLTREVGQLRESNRSKDVQIKMLLCKIDSLLQEYSPGIKQSDDDDVSMQFSGKSKKEIQAPVVGIRNKENQLLTGSVTSTSNELSSFEHGKATDKHKVLQPSDDVNAVDFSPVMDSLSDEDVNLSVRGRRFAHLHQKLMDKCETVLNSSDSMEQTRTEYGTAVQQQTHENEAACSDTQGASSRDSVLRKQLLLSFQHRNLLQAMLARLKSSADLTQNQNKQYVVKIAELSEQLDLLLTSSQKSFYDLRMEFISKLRQKDAECAIHIAKIDTAEHTLAAANETISTLSDRLKHLRREQHNTEQQLNDRIAQHDIEWQRKVNDLRLTNQRLQDELDLTNSEINKLRADLVRKSTELKNGIAKNTSLEDKIRKCHSRITSQEDAVRKSKEDNDNALRIHLDKADEKRRDMEDQIKNKADENNRLTSELRILEERMNRMKEDNAKAEAKFKRQQSEFDKLKHDLFLTGDRGKKLEEMLEISKRESATLSTQVTHNSVELQESKQLLSGAETRYRSLQAKIVELEKKCEALMLKCSGLAKDLQESKDKNQALQNKLSSATMESKQARRNLTDEKKRSDSLKARIRTTEANYEKDKTQIHELENRLKVQEDENLDIISKLRSKTLESDGRSLKLEEMEKRSTKLKRQVTNLEEKCTRLTVEKQTADKERNETDKLHTRHRDRASELEANSERARNEASKERTLRITAQTESDRLQQELQRLAEEIESLKEVLREANSQMRQDEYDYKSRVKALDQRVESLIREKEEASKEAKRAEQSAAEAASRAKSEKEEYLAQIDVLKEEIKHLKTKRDELQRAGKLSASQTAATIEKLRTEYSLVKDEKEKCASFSANLENKLEMISLQHQKTEGVWSDKCDGILKEKKDLADLVENIQTKMATQDSECDEWIRDLKRQISDRDAKIESLRSKHTSIAERHQSQTTNYESKMNDLKRKLTARKKELEQVIEQNKKLSETFDEQKDKFTMQEHELRHQLGHKDDEIFILKMRLNEQPDVTNLSISSFANSNIKRYREAFNIFDKDGDGSITKYEIAQVIKAVGENPDETWVEQLMAEADSDGSGTIEWPEFLRIVSMRNEQEQSDSLALDQDSDRCQTASTSRTTKRESDKTPPVRKR